MKVLMFAAALLFCAPASAQSITGNELHEACTTPSDSHRSGFCSGYVMGIADGTSLGATLFAIYAGAQTADEAVEAAGIALQICIPEGVVHQQIVEVFKSHLENNPAERHNSAKWLFSNAMQEAFPCN